MIEFVLKNRRLRLHPDGVMYVRDHCRGKETKSEKWKEIKFWKTAGYVRCSLTVDGVKMNLFEHRLVYYIHNQDWNILDTGPDNFIDHINRKRDDNRIENLHVVSRHQNNFNRSNVKGYCWYEPLKKYQAYIHSNDKKHHLGYFEKEEDAHNAYLVAKPKYHV